MTMNDYNYLILITGSIAYTETIKINIKIVHNKL